MLNIGQNSHPDGLCVW